MAADELIDKATERKNTYTYTNGKNKHGVENPSIKYIFEWTIFIRPFGNSPIRYEVNNFWNPQNDVLPMKKWSKISDNIQTICSIWNKNSAKHVIFQFEYVQLWKTSPSLRVFDMFLFKFSTKNFVYFWCSLWNQHRQYVVFC